MVANSNGGKDGANIGHPYKPEEVDHFVAMVRSTKKRITDEQLSFVEKELRAQEENDKKQREKAKQEGVKQE
jgi:hypothetical protein